MGISMKAFRRPEITLPDTSAVHYDLFQYDVRIDHLAGLLGAPAGVADPHLARHHGRGRARARLEEAALGQEGVEPDAGHAPHGSFPSPLGESRHELWH